MPKRCQYWPQQVKFWHGEFGDLVCHPSSYINKIIFEKALSPKHGIFNKKLPTGGKVLEYKPIPQLKGYYKNVLEGLYRKSKIRMVLAELFCGVPKRKDFYLSQLHARLESEPEYESYGWYQVFITEFGEMITHPHLPVPFSAKAKKFYSVYLRMKDELSELLEELKKIAMDKTKPLIKEGDVFIPRELGELMEELKFPLVESIYPLEPRNR